MNKGFSLIEVLVFVSVFSIFFIIAIAIVTLSLNNMKVSEHKILATKYAEELREWLRAEKEIDWDSFVTKSSVSGTKYCFKAPLNTWPSIGACGINDFSGITGNSPEIFKREVTLTKPGNYQVNVAITVSWQEVTKTYSVPLNTTFTVWE